MSLEAITWAFAQQVGRSSTKFLLVALAEHVPRGERVARPSVARLCEHTSLDRKTVIAGLKSLETAGFIRRAGTAGKTKQVTIFELQLSTRKGTENGTVSGAEAESESVINDPLNSTENGTGTNSGTGTVFPSEQCRFSAETVPKTGHGSVIEALLKRKTLADSAESTESPPPCPHLKLIALFADKVPELPKPRPELWTGKNADAMKARWKWVLTSRRESGERYATNEFEALSWFGSFFERVQRSDFLTGRSGKWTACNLGWLMKADNFTKVVDNTYRNREVA